MPGFPRSSHICHLVYVSSVNFVLIESLINFVLILNTKYYENIPYRTREVSIVDLTYIEIRTYMYLQLFGVSLKSGACSKVQRGGLQSHVQRQGSGSHSYIQCGRVHCNSIVCVQMMSLMATTFNFHKIIKQLFMLTSHIKN